MINPDNIKSFLLKKKIPVFLFLIIMTCGCATYYMKSMQFQEKVMNGQMEEADKIMIKDKKNETGRNASLHFLNHGYVAFMLKDWSRSNEYFSKADQIIEDLQKNYAIDAAALLTNPMIKPYKPEDFEVVMLNYYTALNYINLGQFDDAMVECKRINNKLNKLNDKYGNKKDRYQHDAFANILMGLIYDADHNYNDAFIAYRNAYEIYENEYSKYFNEKAPEQLRKDLVRTAYMTGFYEEQEEYEKQFGFKYDPSSEPQSNLVFIWLNGFGPVKDEWGIDFVIIPGAGGVVNFRNAELGLDFPFVMVDPYSRSSITDMGILRIAFPKYVERKPYYNAAAIIENDKQFPLEMAENVNDIAFKTLHDRMLRELGVSLLRLASKKAVEYVAKKNNPYLGLAVGIVNAATEKADTRNWQTLPYSFSYARVPLMRGTNNFKLKSSTSQGDSQTYDFTINAEKGKTYFQSFHNIETIQTAMR